MTPEEAIRELDSLPGGPGSDPEGVHCLADGILLKLAGPEVTAQPLTLVQTGAGLTMRPTE